jgi:hypothetical protein
MKKALLSTPFVAILICGLAVGITHFGMVQAFTDVNGIISSNTIWTKANSPYSLSGPMRVNNGVTLSIEAGTIINLNNHSIKVDGTLYAIGSNTEKIRVDNGEIDFTFISIDWNEQTGSGSIIKNAVLSSTILDINNSSPKIDSSFINGHIDCQQGAPIISNNNIIGDDYYAVIAAGSAVISNNIITCTNVQNIGILADGTLISNNTITGLGAYGVKGGKLVSNNVISGFQTGIEATGTTAERNVITINNHGIDLHGGYLRNNTIVNNMVGIYSFSSHIIMYNNIYNNSYNMFLDTTSLEEKSNVDASFNWWGTTDEQAINRSIYDNKNDFNLGTVSFVPVLNESNSQAMPDATSLPSSAPSATPQTPEYPVWIALAILVIAVSATVLISKKKPQNKGFDP